MTEVAYVRRLPECDIHKYDKDTLVPAAYDGKTKHGPWASMCEACFTTHGIGLGPGRGQRYIVGTRPATSDQTDR